MVSIGVFGSFFLDGNPLPDKSISSVDDGQHHAVHVLIGAV